MDINKIKEELNNQQSICIFGIELEKRPKEVKICIISLDPFSYVRNIENNMLREKLQKIYPKFMEEMFFLSWEIKRHVKENIWI